MVLSFLDENATSVVATYPEEGAGSRHLRHVPQKGVRAAESAARLSRVYQGLKYA